MMNSIANLENHRYMWVNYANHAKKQIWNALVNVDDIAVEHLEDLATAAKDIIAKHEDVSPNDIVILDYKYFGAAGLKFIGV